MAFSTSSALFSGLSMNKIPQTYQTIVRIMNISGSPNPEARPFTSDPSNIQWMQDTKADQKAVKRAAKRQASTLDAIGNLSTQINTVFLN